MLRLLDYESRTRLFASSEWFSAQPRLERKGARKHSNNLVFGVPNECPVTGVKHPELDENVAVDLQLSLAHATCLHESQTLGVTLT